MSRLNNYILLLRPQQWVKNFFVFLPVFFRGDLIEWYYIVNSLIAFICFCFIASAVYCINDVIDCESDRVHPVKCNRPIASGAINKHIAIVMMVLLSSCSFAISLWLASAKLAVILAVYFILNVVYCVWLKKVFIIDVFIIAICYVLRIIAGGATCEIWISPWLVCLTFLLALFLAFAKRRDDVVLYEEQGIVIRKNVLNYNLDFLNQTLGIISAITMVCYLIYTLSDPVMERFGSEYVYTTSTFVLAGILRFLQLTIVTKRSRSPTKIFLHDRFIQCCIILWFINFSIIIYL